MNKDVDYKIRYAEYGDKDFWLSLDKHLTESELTDKIKIRQAYILLTDGIPAGILRYNLFWDNTPFCTLLYIDEKFRNRGFGSALMDFWEKEMLGLGCEWVLTSTRSDESAQFFYRKIGYKDCGELNVPDQPMELFLLKELKT